MNIINYEKLRKYKKSDFLKTFDKYKAFLKFLGSPHKFYKTIIITGSTGKGTTAQLVSGILQAHGFKVGCYTSPHLVDVKERIKINSKSITSTAFSRYEKFVLNKIKLFNKKNKNSYMPTFFEILTVIAFLYFRDMAVEYAVIEVGLGGRLDATNVCHPVLNFILPVCLEHTNFLGRSLRKILKEKQEVIKKNSLTVTLIKDERLLNMLKEKCKRLNSTLYRIKKDFHIELNKVKNDYLKFNYKDDNYKRIFKIHITSCDIIENFGAVICGLKHLINIDLDKVYNLFSGIKFPGRFQVLHRQTCKIILDGAHNLLAIQSLVKTLKMLKWRELEIIFTIMSDKKAAGILKELSKVSKKIILTRVGNEREYAMDKLFSITRRYFNEIYLTKDIHHALELVKNHDCIITGSFYLIGEFLKSYAENKDRNNGDCPDF